MFVQTEEDRRQWDEFVEASPQGTVLAKSWCLDALQRIVPEYRGQALIVRSKAGAIEAGVVLFIRRRWFGEAVIPPGVIGCATVLLPPIDRKDESRTVERRGELLDKLLSGLMSQRFRSIVMEQSPNLTDIREFLWHGWRAVPRYSYIQDVAAFEPETTLSRNHGKNYRKAQRAGYSIAGGEATASHVDEFLEMFPCSYKGTRRKAFDRDCKKVRGYLSLFIDQGVALYYAAKDASGIAQSGRFVLLSPHKSVLDWQAATTDKGRDDGATVFVMTEMFKDLRQRGIESFDYSGANTRSIAQFKAGFNPTLVPYFNVEWHPPGLLRRLKDLAKPLVKRLGIR